MLLNRFPPVFSGSGLQGQRLARALVQSEAVEVTVLSAQPVRGEGGLVERDGGYELHRFRIPSVDRARRFTLGLKVAWWLLTHRHWELLHVHGYSYFAFLPCLIAQLRGRAVLAKTTLFMQGENSSLPSRMISGVYRRSDVIVVLSDAIERQLRQDPKLRARIARIPNGVDSEVFRPASEDQKRAARRELGLSADCTVVSTVGSLEHRKNPICLIRAVRRMSERPVCLVLAGPASPSAEERAAVNEAVAETPAGVEIRLPGCLNTDQVVQLMRASDVFALASRAEGLPNGLLEGMASGLACVASDVPGSRDVLKDGGGILVPVDDEDALAAVVDQLARDPVKREQLGVEARQVIEREYSMRSIASRYLETYADLLS